MKRRLLLLLLLPVLIFGVFRLYAQQASNGLLVLPSNFELSLNPGESTTKVIHYHNQTDNDVQLKIDLRNFTANGEEGQVNLTDGEEDSTYSLAKWITVSPETAVVPAHGTKDFTFVVNVPENAEPGGHFGSVVFASVPPDELNETGAGLSQEIGALLLVRVAGDVVEKASVESFTTDKMFYEFGPVVFDLRVKNSGGVHIKPYGSILITDMFGKKTSVDLDGQNVLPGSVRKMDTTWNKNFLIGKYKADLVAAYGTQNQPLTASVEFYTFPVRYGLIVLAGIFILFMMRKRLGKAFKALFGK